VRSLFYHKLQILYGEILRWFEVPQKIRKIIRRRVLRKAELLMLTTRGRNLVLR
jgi:hypothetical protein